MPSLSIADTYEGGYNHGRLIRAEIREGFGKHQIAILDYPVPASNFTALAPELTPMTFQWATSPTDVRTFYGYVNHHEYWDSDRDGTMYLRFFCIGPSQPLNDPDPKSWSSVTGSFIARQVAEQHGLRAVVQNSKSILPYWSPGQDGDFKMMNRLAEQTGFQFWVDGTTLYFIDPETLLASAIRSTASYTMDRDPNDTLFGVQAISGSLAPVALAPSVQTVFGIDAVTGNLIQASSTQQLTQKGLPAPGIKKVYPKSVNSLAQAVRITDSASTAGVWSSILALTVGDAKPRLGSLVDLGGAALNQSFQGTWLVRDAIHIISADPSTALTKYSTQLELTRNQKDQIYFSSTRTITGALSEVSAILRNGKSWESSVLESVYV